jgi:hypothetical protein
MADLKVFLESADRKLVTKLIKAERRNIEVSASNPVTTGAQRRAVDFYEQHLKRIQKRLNPNDNWLSKT